MKRYLLLLLGGITAGGLTGYALVRAIAHRYSKTFHFKV